MKLNFALVVLSIICLIVSLVASRIIASGSKWGWFIAIPNMIFSAILLAVIIELFL